MTDRLLINLRIATMRQSGMSYGMIDHGCMVLSGDRIAWVGERKSLPVKYKYTPEEDMQGRLATPGLIDCHTHLVYGGDRAKEFELRLEGASYEEIARAGGGIVSTVSATRAASEDDLVNGALTRLDHLIAEGVTTVEIKSGYGLSTEDESKMLRAARQLGTRRPVDIKTTFLGAHALPPEYKDREDAYIDLVCDDMLPSVAREGLADAVDAFCEGIAFSVDQTERVFAKARELGLPVKIHSEQLSNLGGTALAASYSALSADHLEFVDQAGIDAMAKSGTVAVLLPGAFYTLRETQLPPVQALRDAGVPIALATDANPGSSPLTSLLLVLNMACTLFRMTPEEALSGVTRNAATALGLQENAGTLEPGKLADIAIWDVKEPAELSYRIGFNPLHRRIYRGVDS